MLAFEITMMEFSKYYESLSTLGILIAIAILIIGNKEALSSVFSAVKSWVPGFKSSSTVPVPSDKVTPQQAAFHFHALDSYFVKCSEAQPHLDALWVCLRHSHKEEK